MTITLKRIDCISTDFCLQIELSSSKNGIRSLLRTNLIIIYMDRDMGKVDIWLFELQMDELDLPYLAMDSMGNIFYATNQFAGSIDRFPDLPHYRCDVPKNPHHRYIVPVKSPVVPRIPHCRYIVLAKSHVGVEHFQECSGNNIYRYFSYLKETHNIMENVSLPGKRSNKRCKWIQTTTTSFSVFFITSFSQEL